MSPSEPTETEGGPSASAPVSKELSHGRYLLEGLIGAGGFGQVHRALDRFTNEPVAIKFIPALSSSDLARARRELAALRWLSLPGVIHLRDDGFDGESWFLVMDLVEGLPFDAAARAEPWERWSVYVLELLEILARVHLSGVLHLDLKPSNVLVTPEGRVIVLDFGIARGRAIPETEPGRVEGTPRYMAPEQARGGPCDARTDLYALGKMLGGLPTELPPHVSSLVRSLCAEDPADRPSSALEVYEALAGRSPFPAALSRREPWSPQELRELFAGPDPFVRVASDAADWLWQATGGAPAEVRAILERAISGGLATWSEGRLLLDRTGLERARGADAIGLSEGELTEPLPAILRRAHALRERGRLGAAAALLDAVAPLARGEGGELERKMLVERTLAAIATERPAALEPALYALECSAQTPFVAQLTALVRLGRSTLRREALSASEQAEALAPFDEPDLEIWRQAFRVRSRGITSADAEAELLEELVPWAEGDGLREAKRWGWLGNHLYRRGRYREAALAHERAAEGKVAADRLGSLVNAATSWLEALDLERTERRAREAEQLAVELRHPVFEALMVWLLRTISYRALRPLPHDPALLEGARALGPSYEALFALTDAAAAWRRGEALCASLAERASACFRAANMAPLSLLTAALAAFVSRDDGALIEIAALAAGGPIPDIELQTLAFASWRAGELPPERLLRMQELAESRPREHWSIPLDILSVEESLARSPPEIVSATERYDAGGR